MREDRANAAYTVEIEGLELTFDTHGMLLATGNPSANAKAFEWAQSGKHNLTVVKGRYSGLSVKYTLRSKTR